MIFLKLYYDKRLKDPTYYVQQGIRNGNKTTTKNVKRIGKHSELLKITDNPLEYAKEEIKKMNEAYGKGTLSLNYSINFNEKVTDTENTISASTYQNIGYFYLKKIYNQLALPQFFNEVAKNKKITFDCNAINEFLTYSRILSPQSKAGTFDKLETYYKPADFSLHHIFRFMDILAENYDNYIEHLYHKSNHVVPRNSKIMYYDCSNYYFEINQADDVYTDEVTGETIYGLRQFGFSKQHQPRPLVSMGLIMDSNGIPVTMCIYPGNANEQTTAIPMEKQLQKIINHDQFIYCADAGLASYHIRQFNSMGGKRFIVTQSIKKLPAEDREWALNTKGFKRLSDDSPVDITQLSEDDKLVVSRARKVQRFLSQPFFVAGQFTGLEGRYVPVSETIQGFKEIIEGKYDDIPESYFLNCGGIDDVLAKKEKEITMPAAIPENIRALVGLLSSSSPSRHIISNNRCGDKRSCSSSMTCFSQDSCAVVLS